MINKLLLPLSIVLLIWAVVATIIIMARGKTKARVNTHSSKSFDSWVNSRENTSKGVLYSECKRNKSKDKVVSLRKGRRCWNQIQ